MSWWTSDRVSYALHYLINNAGLTPVGAAGLVSRWKNVEASAGPASRNPYSGAFGIAQWLGARKAPINGNTNFDAQLAYVIQELNGSESRAANVLRSAMTSQQAATGASMYERAEGYNAATGNDNWTSTTAAGIPAVYAALSPLSPGGSIGPVVTPIATDDSGDTNSLPYSDAFGSPSLSSSVAIGGLSTGAIIAIGASLVLLYLVWE